jgi:hypothetical protein
LIVVSPKHSKLGCGDYGIPHDAHSHIEKGQNLQTLIYTTQCTYTKRWRWPNMALMGAGIEQDHLETRNQHGLRFSWIWNYS